MSEVLSSFYPIEPHEIDPSRLFFTTVNVAKKKGILDEKELKYVDGVINEKFTDAFRGKDRPYLKKESAKQMFEGLFRVIDSAYTREACGISPDFAVKIIDSIKQHRLSEMWDMAVRGCAKDFERLKRRIYHLEYLDRKFPGFMFDYISDVKAELTYTDIYRLGSESTPKLLGVTGLEAPACVQSICRSWDMMCACTELVCRIKPVEVERASELVGCQIAGKIRYNLKFLTAVALSTLYSGFYRVDSMFIPFGKIVEIEDDITELENSELCSFFRDCIDIFINRKGIDVNECNNATGEIARLCAFTLHDGDITAQSFAEYLTEYVRTYCKTKADVQKLLFFDA